ncbi:hypothetical protein ABKN59_007061 [Abortiporus biennis]
MLFFMSTMLYHYSGHWPLCNIMCISKHELAAQLHLELWTNLVPRGYDTTDQPCYMIEIWRSTFNNDSRGFGVLTCTPDKFGAWEKGQRPKASTSLATRATDHSY